MMTNLAVYTLSVFEKTGSKEFSSPEGATIVWALQQDISSTNCAQAIMAWRDGEKFCASGDARLCSEKLMLENV